VAAPLLGLAALAAKLEDRGPVLYRQTRVGRGGADFELLKLRTMVVGAERQGAGFARLDLKILGRTPLALFGGTYKGETGGWRAT